MPTNFHNVQTIAHSPAQRRMQHTATHCNTLQCTATTYMYQEHTSWVTCAIYVAHCNTLQHAATHCNTLHYTATHCNILQHTATHGNTLQHTATHCNTLQHTATHCIPQGHTSWVTSAKFDGDGRLLCSVSKDRSLRMWDVQVCMYVYVYVCIYACMHVYIYVCM